MNSVLSLQGVEFSYGTTAILSIPDFSMKAQEKVFLYGPSGSGKSTLLELITGILSPREGKVSVLDQDISALVPHQRDQFRADHLGYIFQSFNLIPYLNVRENIELPGRLSRFRRERGGADQLKRITETLGISQLMDRQVTNLSVGQQQRVAAARSLYGKPELLLADEPTSALDYDHREKFIQLLFAIAREQGMAVLFVSHDRTLEKLFDRSVALSELNRISSRQELA